MPKKNWTSYGSNLVGIFHNARGPTNWVTAFSMIPREQLIIICDYLSYIAQKII